MGHETHNQVSLEIARRVATELGRSPGWIEFARANLDRWSQRNADAPRLLACYREWRAILERPIPEIVGVLLDASDEGQRLRQSSPFAGVLSAREVWEIKRRLRDEQDSA